jgi:Skp family chaperone for outer membrane proteins
MKRYSTALLFGLLSLTSQLAHADIVDDAIGNIQQAINDAYNPSSSRSNDDDDRYDRSRQIDSRQYDDRRRQLEDRRRRLDERQRQLDDDRRRSGRG